MTMRLNTEFDNVTGREDPKRRGDGRPDSCMEMHYRDTERRDERDRISDSLHHSAGTRNRSHNGTRETKFTVSQYRYEKPFITGREGPDFWF